jgi:hypothetical protein
MMEKNLENQKNKNLRIVKLSIQDVDRPLVGVSLIWQIFFVDAARADSLKDD